MGDLGQDIKFGVRMMTKTPVVTIVAVLSLALAIASNGATFSLLNAFLFEPFPYGDQDELVMFRTLRQGEGMDMAGGVSVPNFRDYLEASSSIEDGALYSTEQANLTGMDVPEQLSVVVTTPNLFDVLQVVPEIGRSFRPEEGADGAGRVLVLHHDYWQRRFLGDREVLGRTVTLDGDPYTIIGVMPEGFDLIPANIQAFRPTDFAAQMEDRGSRGYLNFARLATGATATQAQLEVEGPHSRLAAEYSDQMRGIEVAVQPAREFFPGPTDKQLISILAVVTLFGLLIACANIANLLLSRAEERQREVAVRTALGAGRHRILRQLLTESVLMGTLAGVIGVGLALWVVRWIQTAMPAEMPAAMIPRLAPEVIIATLALSMLAGVVFGIAPALQAGRGDLRDSLEGGARGGTAGRRRKRLRNLFVIGEVAVALALLSGSGFLIEAFQRVTNSDPGFEASGLLTFQITVLGDRYVEAEDVVAYQQELVRTLESVPGVESVAAMSSLPRGRDNSRTRYAVVGRPELDPVDLPTAGLQTVSEAYFRTLEVELRQGRVFTEADRIDAPLVAVVSEGFAAREFPDTDPIGESVFVANSPRRIVGIVEDIVQERIQLAGRDGEMIYLPATQVPLRAPSFALRTTGDPTALSADVRQAVWSVEADQPIAQLRPLQAHIDESLAGPRSIALFLMVIGGIALALAAMGIYGVISHAVAQQQREIGIRMALGAGRGAMVGMVTRSGLSLVGIGVVAGLPLAYLMFRSTLTGLNLFNTELGFGYPIALSATLLTVAVLATVVPAGRASRIAPVAALKE